MIFFKEQNPFNISINTINEKNRYTDSKKIKQQNMYIIKYRNQSNRQINSKKLDGEYK